MTVSDRLAKYERWISGIAVLLFGAALLVFSFKIWHGPEANDFQVYFRIADRMATHQWLQMYSLDDRDGILRYSPIILPLFWPLKFFGFYEARLLWSMVNWAAFLLSLFLLRGVLIREFKWTVKRATFAVVLTFLLCLRVFLSSLIEGQIVGVMLFGLTLALRGFLARDEKGPAIGLLIPNALKIGFALLYPLMWIRGTRYLLAVAFSTVAFVLSGLLVTMIMAGGPSVLWQLILGWLQMLNSVLDGDSVHYWLCSHYSSQAWNSVLLRAYEWGWMSGQTARGLWLSSAALGLALLMVYWFAKRKTRDPLGLAILFSMGIMAYLILMPFTYRHTFTFGLIPVFCLVIARPNRWSVTALIAWFLFVGVAGLDIVGKTLFFGMQNLSFPFAAMALVTAALFVTFERRHSHG